MKTLNTPSWGDGPLGIIVLLLVIFFIFAFVGHRHFFHNTGQDIRSTVHDAGADLKSTGRDAAASIRDAVQ